MQMMQHRTEPVMDPKRSLADTNRDSPEPRRVIDPAEDHDFKVGHGPDAPRPPFDTAGIRG